MRQALSQAGLQASEIDYINLHGTGTPDNDRAEARAVHALLGNTILPPVSSLKGSLGHTLGAAGAVNAAISVLCIRHGIIPANTGCREPDPALQLVPVCAPLSVTLALAATVIPPFVVSVPSRTFPEPLKVVRPVRVRPVPLTVPLFTVVVLLTRSGLRHCPLSWRR